MTPGTAALQDVISTWTSRFSGRSCLDDLTGTDVVRYLNSTTAHWQERGVRPGDCVIVTSRDQLRTCLAALAAFTMGTVPVLAPRYLTDSQLERTAQLCNAWLLPHGITACRPLSTSQNASINPRTELIACTSGTTGDPKLAQHTVGGVIPNARAIVSHLDLYQDDTILILRDIGQLSVFVGEVLVALLANCRLRFATSSSSIIWDAARFNPAFMVTIPSLFRLQLPSIKRLSHQIQGVRNVLLVGEAARVEDVDLFQHLLPLTNIMLGYGATEVGPRISIWHAARHPHVPYCVGQLLPGMQVRVLDDLGHPVSTGDHGHLHIASHSVMLGYVGGPPSHGTFYPHDIGWFDSSGLLYVVQRSDDVIIRSGIKIFPSVIELALLSHPAVDAALAKRSLSSTTRVRVEALAVTSDKRITVDELVAWTRACLARPMWPDIIRLVDDLPRSVSGKVSRSTLHQGPGKSECAALGPRSEL